MKNKNIAESMIALKADDTSILVGMDLKKGNLKNHKKVDLELIPEDRISELFRISNNINVKQNKRSFSFSTTLVKIAKLLSD